MAGCSLLVVAIAAGSIVGLTSSQAVAQDRQMREMDERIGDLEDQLRSITRYLSKNEDAPRDYNPAGAGGAQATDQMANMEVRLNALENQIRDLTGQLEETQHQISQVNDRLDRLAASAEPVPSPNSNGGGAAAFGGAAGAAGAANTQPNGAGGNVEAGNVEAGAPEPLPAGEPTAVYNAALAKLRQDDFRGAAQGFQDFVLQFPDNDLTPNAQYWLGEAYYAQQNYSEAARAFLTAYTKYPKSSKASGALLKLGISLGELDQTEDACAALREFNQKYPNASPIELNRANVARQDLNCS